MENPYSHYQYYGLIAIVILTPIFAATSYFANPPHEFAPGLLLFYFVNWAIWVTIVVEVVILTKLMPMLLSRMGMLDNAVSELQIKEETILRHNAITIEVFKNKNDILRKCGAEALRNFLDSFDAQSNYIKFRGEQASLSANDKLWEELTLIQGRRVNSKSEPPSSVIIYTTHIVSAHHSWEPYTSSWWISQRSLAQAKATIVRIFLEFAPEEISASKRQEYLTAFKRMHAMGINVCYVRYDRTLTDLFDPGFLDFGIILSEGLISLWQIDPRTKKISSTEIRALMPADVTSRRVTTNWNRIMQDIVEDVNRAGSNGVSKDPIEEEVRQVCRDFQLTALEKQIHFRDPSAN